MDYKNIFSLEGKKAVVIGGGGGIGQEIAKALSTFGAEVVIASRNLEALQTVAQTMESETGYKVHACQVDVSSEESIISLVEETKAIFGTADILVNSQGLNKKAVMTEQPMDLWDAMYSVNVRGVFIAIKEFSKGMIEKGSGRIINVGSIGAILSTKGGNSVGYGSTKGAVDSMTTNMCGYLGQYGITINNICPIITETPMMVEIFKKNPTFKEMIAGRVPLGRIGIPSDCAGIAVFLASEAACFVSGQRIYADGGLQTQQ